MTDKAPRKRPARPTDANQLGKMIVDLSTGEESVFCPVADTKDPAAVSLGRRGGLKGGKARADKLSPERRAEIARAAAAKRWDKKVVMYANQEPPHDVQSDADAPSEGSSDQLGNGHTEQDGSVPGDPKKGHRNVAISKNGTGSKRQAGQRKL